MDRNSRSHPAAGDPVRLDVDPVGHNLDSLHAGDDRDRSANDRVEDGDDRLTPGGDRVPEPHDHLSIGKGRGRVGVDCGWDSDHRIPVALD